MGRKGKIVLIKFDGVNYPAMSNFAQREKHTLYQHGDVHPLSGELLRDPQIPNSICLIKELANEKRRSRLLKLNQVPKLDYFKAQPKRC